MFLRERPPVIAVVLVVIAGCGESSVREEAPITSAKAPEVVQQPVTMSAPGEGVVAEFDRRVKDYVTLMNKLDDTLSELPDDATPRQVDAHQRALGALIAKARADAKAGEVFVPEMQVYVRGVVRSVLDGPDGGRIKASLMDENPVGATPVVNKRYPDQIPLSTMPPDILAALPALPAGLEYRFVGRALILLDPRSHLIVDFVDNAIGA
jgi:hypothetical protein